jgi:hypothetical protein
MRSPSREPFRIDSQKNARGESTHDIPDELAPEGEGEEDRFDPTVSLAGLIEGSEEQIIEDLIKCN